MLHFLNPKYKPDFDSLPNSLPNPLPLALRLLIPIPNSNSILEPPPEPKVLHYLNSGSATLRFTLRKQEFLVPLAFANLSNQTQVSVNPYHYGDGYVA